MTTPRLRTVRDVGMDRLSQFLEAVRDQGVAAGHFRGLMHLLIGESIRLADGRRCRQRHDLVGCFGGAAEEESLGPGVAAAELAPRPFAAARPGEILGTRPSRGRESLRPKHWRRHALAETSARSATRWELLTRAPAGRAEDPGRPGLRNCLSRHRRMPTLRRVFQPAQLVIGITQPEVLGELGEESAIRRDVQTMPARRSAARRSGSPRWHR